MHRVIEILDSDEDEAGMRPPGDCGESLGNGPYSKLLSSKPKIVGGAGHGKKSLLRNRSYSVYQPRPASHPAALLSRDEEVDQGEPAEVETAPKRAPSTVIVPPLTKMRLRNRCNSMYQSVNKDSVPAHQKFEGSEITAETLREAVAAPLRKARIRNRRKSTHQPLSSEMQFETVGVNNRKETEDKDEELRSAAEQQITDPCSTTPNILASDLTEIESAFECFLDSEKTSRLFSDISNERVRINYLLSLYDMPEINFSLYTNPEKLRFQVDESLRQHRIVSELRKGKFSMLEKSGK